MDWLESFWRIVRNYACILLWQNWPAVELYSLHPNLFQVLNVEEPYVMAVFVLHNCLSDVSDVIPVFCTIQFPVSIKLFIEMLRIPCIALSCNI